MSGHLQVRPLFLRGMPLGTHCMGNWVGPRADLVAVKKNRIIFPDPEPAYCQLSRLLPGWRYDMRWDIMAPIVVPFLIETVTDDAALSNRQRPSRSQSVLNCHLKCNVSVGSRCIHGWYNSTSTHVLQNEARFIQLNKGYLP